MAAVGVVALGGVGVDGVEEVVFEGVERRLGRFRLVVPGLRLGAGLHVVVGPNGSGKTTLLRVMLGLLRPGRGRVLLRLRGGGVVSGQRLLGFGVMVPAEVQLPNARVGELLRVMAGLESGGLREVVEAFGLGGVVERRFLELSSGFRRRVVLAVALSVGAPVLALDEPFENVDSRFQGVLEEVLLEYSRRPGRLVVVTSHVPTRLLEEGSIVYMEDGRVLFHGRVPGLLGELVEARVGGAWVPVARLLREAGVRVEGLRVRSLPEKLREAAGS